MPKKSGLGFAQLARGTTGRVLRKRKAADNQDENCINTVMNNKNKPEDLSQPKRVYLNDLTNLVAKKCSSKVFGPLKTRNGANGSQDTVQSSQGSVAGSTSPRSDVEMPLPVLGSQSSHSSTNTSLDCSQPTTDLSESQQLFVKPDIDIDVEYKDDPNQLPEFAWDVFNFMRNSEADYNCTDYLLYQPGVTEDMRSILVDWMVEVQENFELNHETLYLGVRLTDIFLCLKKSISKDLLQLVGVCCLFISCKLDERIPPCLDDFLFICDDAYTRNQMLTMEKTILHHLNFKINAPISYRFLRRYARCIKAPMVLLTLGRYILELSLLDYSHINSSPSLLAAGALYIALTVKGGKPWCSTLYHFSGYAAEQIVPVANSLLESNRNYAVKENLQTIVQKYSHPVFHKVALVQLPVELTLPDVR